MCIWTDLRGLGIRRGPFRIIRYALDKRKMIDQKLHGPLPPPTIRYATAQDSLLLADLGARTFYDAYAPALPPAQLAEMVSALFSPARQAAELADPTTIFLIAEVDGVTAGYALLRGESGGNEESGGRTLKVARIYLEQAWIGRGLGSTLMKAVLAEAATRGFDTITLEVWEQNARARAFYRKWGFEEVGSVPFHFGGDIQTDLVLRRRADARRP